MRILSDKILASFDRLRAPESLFIEPPSGSGYRERMSRLTIHVTEREGVAIVSPANPEFDTLVTPLLGRLAERALKLKPYLAVVWNQSPRAVVAFTSEWVSFPNSNGATTTARSHMKFPDAVCGPALGRTGPQGIPPGGKMVVSASCNVQPESLESGDGVWLDQFVQEKERRLANATDLRIGLDAVIFDDGLLVGPDSTGLATAFGTHVNAKQEIYQMLGKRLTECNASEDVFEPVRAMLMTHENLKSLRDANAMERNQAAAEVISWQRRALLEPLKTARTEPFVIRRRDAPDTT